MAGPAAVPSTTRCAICGNDNPASNAYCGQCGAQLNADSAAFAERVRAVIHAELKDQNAFEIETTEKIFTRLMGWAKSYAVVVGSCIAILALTLAIWGITKFVDVNSKLNDAEKKAEKLAASSGNITARYNQLEKDLAQYEKLDQQVQVLQSNVTAISKRIGFTPSADLSPELEQHLNSVLAQFDVFLRSLDYSPGDERVTVSVVNSLGNNVSSTYSPTEHKIEITKKSAEQEGFLLVDYMPIALRRHESGSTSYLAVSDALSRYIPASFLGHAVSGWPVDYGPDRWPDAVDEANLNNAAQSLFKALWKLRGTIPSGILDRAALKGWAETQELYRDPHYQKLFVEQLVMELPQGERDRVRRFFSDRNILPK